LIAEHPRASRRELSRRLCEAWNWRQHNGTLRDMVCRSLMLVLHRRGDIELPPVRWVNPNPLARRGPQRSKPGEAIIDTSPISGKLATLRPLEFRQVRRTPEESLFNSLLEQYHFLGYTQPVGEHVKYLVHAVGRPVACLAWSSAPRHLGPRDRFIGWSAEARRKNIRFIAYNTRFLIVPWATTVANLASHILGRMPTVLSRDWERIYGHPVYFLETFIDPARSRGTCYRAANWVPLGLTTGRGKDSTSKRPNRTIKEVLGYPIWKRFRELLGEIE
ncbi:MAG: Druantia anti-phage system protein DruA, partial [Gammaproteobacteria bacterium]